MRRVDLTDETHQEIEKLSDELGVPFEDMVLELIKQGLAVRRSDSRRGSRRRSRIPALILKPGPRVKGETLSATIIRERRESR